MQTINTTTASIAVGATSEEEAEAGVPPIVQLVFGQAILFQPTPQMPPIPIPFGQQVVELSKEHALGIAEQVKKAAESLPDPRPDIPIASSLEGVDEVANFDRNIREGGPLR